MNWVHLVPLVACSIALWFDLKPKHEIPNSIFLFCLLTAFVLVVLGIMPLIPAIIGFFFYSVFGILLMIAGYWGSGDAKIMMGIGAFYGVLGKPTLLFFAFLALGMGLFAVLLRRKKSIGMPYFVLAALIVYLFG